MPGSVKSKASSKGKQFLSSKEGARIRQAQVDRKHFLEDFTSGVMVNDLYKHREHARGRADFVADEEGGYFVEGKSPSPTAKRWSSG